MERSLDGGARWTGALAGLERSLDWSAGLERWTRARSLDWSARWTGALAEDWTGALDWSAGLER